MSTASPASSLAEAIRQFRSKVNGDARLEPILRGWEPVIVLEVLGTGFKQHLLIRDCRIADVSSHCGGAAHVVHLRASEDVLTAVFDGRTNPTEAFLDGELQVFASDKDQVKLDAISLTLWGS